MFSPALTAVGRGRLEVWRDGELRQAHDSDNMVLNGFYDYFASKQPYTGLLSPSIKLGKGNIISTPEMTQLSVRSVLKSGSWPKLSNLGGDTARIGPDGTKVLVSLPMEFAFTLGQVDDSITEYGVDFAGATTATDIKVHTRILTTDSQGAPAAIPVTTQDQLIIKYTIELQGDLIQPVYQIEADTDGVKSTHAMQMKWGQAAQFWQYLANIGWQSSSNIGMYFANIDLALADNLVRAPLLSYVNGPVAYSVVGDVTTMTGTCPSTAATIVGGCNYVAAYANAPWWFMTIDPPLPRNNGQTLVVAVSRNKRGTPVV